MFSLSTDNQICSSKYLHIQTPISLVHMVRFWLLSHYSEGGGTAYLTLLIIQNLSQLSPRKQRKYKVDSCQIPTWLIRCLVFLSRQNVCIYAPNDRLLNNLFVCGLQNNLFERFSREIILWLIVSCQKQP